MENTFAQIFYSTIINDVYNLGNSNEQYIRDTISNNYELLLNEYQNKNDIEKNDIVQYFTNLANIKKNEYETTQSWDSYWAGRKYNEYILIIDILSNI
jgi:hypothetical protein